MCQAAIAGAPTDSSVTKTNTTRLDILSAFGLPGKETSKFTLDDFIYRREPLDKIYDAILAYVAPAEESSSDEEAKATEPPAS